MVPFYKFVNRTNKSGLTYRNLIRFQKKSSPRRMAGCLSGKITGTILIQKGLGHEKIPPSRKRTRTSGCRRGIRRKLILQTRIGARAAENPRSIFCDYLNQWSENETYLGADGIFADAGDITPSQANMPIETEQAAGQLYEAGLKVMAFGGDHSVTYPLVKAAAKHHPNLSILHFDAHPDLYDNFEDNPNSHASPFARNYGIRTGEAAGAGWHPHVQRASTRAGEIVLAWRS